MIKRRKTREVKVGNLIVGGEHAVTVQSMTTTKTHDIKATLNEVDTREMAGEAENYEIKTQKTFIDGLIGVLTYSLISPRTVTVTK